MITPSQSSSILARHANEIAPLRLLELCADEDRVASMMAVCNNEDEDRLLILDFSRQRMTLDTVNHLLRLSASLHIPERIEDLAYGRLGQQRSAPKHWEGPISPTVSFANDEMHSREASRGSMHLSLRMPVGSFVPAHANSSKNVLDAIHSEWRRIQSLSIGIREGNVRSSSPLVDVLVIGGAVVSSALKFVYSALAHDKSTEVNSSLVTPTNLESSTKMNNVESIIQTIVKTPFKNKDGQSSTGASLRRRKLRFLNSTDPSVFVEATSDLSPGTTCVITLDVDQEHEEGCQAMTMMVRNWIVSGNSNDAADIVRKQMYLVTAKEKISKTSAGNTFLIPNHSACEAFATLSAAGLLPLSILVGWDLVSELLSGAHSLDKHFVETNPRHNLAILLGLIDTWNDAFMDLHGRVMTPYVRELGYYPRFASILEQRVCSGKKLGDWSLRKKEIVRPMPVIDGANASYAESRVVAEFITAMDPVHNDTNKSTDDRMCFMLNKADTLAFGNREHTNNNAGILSPGSPPAIQSCDSMLSTSSGVNGPSVNPNESGNQPSTLIILGKFDAFSCGQLVALAEHRALIKSWLWGIDPFDSPQSVPRADGLREGLTQMYQKFLSEDEDVQNTTGADFGMNGTTKTLLKHYVTRMERHKT
ncbi:hypothetical protein ACHAXN_009268 [Cyclotella atomus]